MSFFAQAPGAVSTTFTFATGAAESNLYDGNDATSAADPGGLTASTRAAYDLGSAKPISRCRIITAVSNGFSNSATFNIEYSDTSLTAGFTTATTIVIPAGLAQVVIKDFTGFGAHRFWRVLYASGTTGGNAWLGELTFYADLPAAGAFTVSGNQALFSAAAPSTNTACSVSGNSATFSPKLVPNVSNVALSSNLAAFNFAFPVTGTAYVLAGNAAPLTSKLNSGTTAFAMSGSSTVTLQTWGAAGAPCLIASVGAPLTRDYINWLVQPFQGAGWINPAAPSSAWTPIALPSTTWTIDPTQTIPLPVSE
jgi:hypothetical protein